MTVIRIRTEDGYFMVGDKKRKKLFDSGCNEPFNGRFWCPARKWFSSQPCPFLNKRECNNYKSMCGNL